MEIQAQVTSQTNIVASQPNPEIESAREDANETGSERTESNRKTPDSSPAVVSNISASSLQASRVANASSNVEAQQQLSAVIAIESKNQTNPTNEQLSSTGNQTLQTSRVDTVV